MANYFRITAYYPEKDISVILDSNGKFEKLWQFSAYLVQRGFKIIEVGKIEDILEDYFPSVKEESNKIYLRGIDKGRPQVDELVYKERPCKCIIVSDKIYGQFYYPSSEY